MDYIEEIKKTEIIGDYDVIICGGGPAGLSAAISASREGARTLLIEANGCVGGVWTSGLLSVILDVKGKGGILSEVKRELHSQNAILPRGNEYNFLYDSEKMKVLTEKMCQEASVDILLHTRVVDTICAERRITAIIVENCEGRKAIKARNFIDATGDGYLSYKANCSYDIGHPDSGKTQPASLQAIVIGVPQQFQNMVHYEEKRKFYTFLKELGLDVSGKAPTIVRLPFGETYTLSVNHEIGIRSNSATDITNASIHARREIDNVITGLKKVSGWEKLQLVTTAAQIGIREGRRIQGKYQITLSDIVNGQQFEDGICLARFAVDIHALDKESTHGYGNEGIIVHPYQIPFRSLIADEIDNLGLAGRCISGDFYAHASYRVTGNAVPMGEAIGYGAALASKNHCDLPELNGSEISKEMVRRGYEL